jgi:Icc-related predicted phosphoesterase
LSENNIVRLAVVGDIHYSKATAGPLQSLFAQINEQADILALCGDLTDYGLPDEAQSLARDLSAVVRIPIVAVLGNHDFESGKQEEVNSILRDAGINMLDGDACEIRGIGFAGTKGFCGGFGPRTLAPWGEAIIKQFVREAIEEALKLESALARLRTERRYAILHYAPIRDTVEGEPTEIFAFLGSSRLEEPLGRFPVDAVFHGHAHHGSVQGETSTGVPVYNVAMSLLLRSYPDLPPFHLVQVPVGGRPGQLILPRTD